MKINIKTLKCLLVASAMTAFYGCAESTEDIDNPKVVFKACSQTQESNGECTRFMERKIYFANYNSGEPDKNEIFAVQKVKDALNDIAADSDLGDNYFSFENVDGNLLQPVVERTDGIQWRSFVQVWPDAEFNSFLSELPFQADSNAIVAINQANRRQFWIILRASCFDSNQVSCTNDNSATFTSNMGLFALVGRTLSRLIGMTVKDCSLDPDHTMCAEFPSDTQWSLSSKNQFFANIRNALDTVSSNENFYEAFFVEN